MSYSSLKKIHSRKRIRRRQRTMTTARGRVKSIRLKLTDFGTSLI